MKNKQIFKFLITETMILVDRRRGGMNTRRVREELALRIQKWRLDYTARHGEKRHESLIIWPTFDRNFNLQMGKSFNFI